MEFVSYVHSILYDEIVMSYSVFLMQAVNEFVSGRYINVLTIIHELPS